ncbi:MAG: hypothetical protein ACRDTH_17280 [Pseudonocardiaceae bacterium]
MSPRTAEAEASARLGCNVLVHAYLDVDPARIWTHLGRLNDLENFAHAADAYLEG